MRPIRTRQERPAASRNLGSQNLLGWLGRDAQMVSVVATAQRYAQIRLALAALLPAGLADAVQVVKLDHGQLTLATPGAAYVTKLRQLAPRLADALTRQGWHVNEVSIRIHAQTREEGHNMALNTRAAQKKTRQAMPLDAQALQAFSSLHNRLSAGPLADAVQRLLKHHGASS